MKIRLGYVSIPVSIGKLTPSSTMTYTYYKTLEESAAIKRLDEIIRSNFSDLKKILYYNKQNEIQFYRLTSNLIPLATHPNISCDFYHIYQKELKEIGTLMKDYHMRVDTHPNQYCVLNSTNSDVVCSSINILKDQYDMYQTMGINGKIILHIGGGTYGKKAGINRFIKNFQLLPESLQNSILLENDDKLYTVSDVLMVCEKLKIPMVLDYHHHLCNPCEEELTELLDRIYDTWKNETLSIKMHFSSPKNKQEFRSHNTYIDLDSFLSFLKLLKKKNQDVDVMLEAKGKDEALFRLIRGLKYKNIIVNGTTILM